MKIKSYCKHGPKYRFQKRGNFSKRQRLYLPVKRVADIAGAIIGLTVLGIPFILIAILQKLSAPSEPVFFCQRRVGQYRHIFYIIKFRTMKSTAPKYQPTGEFYRASKYISRLGWFLRETSIDELPQLFNVLRGDMSLIGPRPLIRQERNVHRLRRNQGVDMLKPGITGWAQINGRDLLDNEQKVFYDTEYLKNFGLKFDFLIFFRSLWKVIKRCDVRVDIAAQFACGTQENSTIAEDRPVSKGEK